MLTVKQAAQRAGISPTTLRAWERRYDVLEPGRTPAGYRIYDEASLDRLRTMAALVHAGWSPSKAAQHIRERVESGSSDVPPKRRADGSVPDQAHRQLADVAQTLDTHGLEALLDAKFAVDDLEAMLVDWLLPNLRELGFSWADEDVSVAGEHLVSSAVLGRLSARLQSTPGPDNAPTLMVGLPEGAHHEIGAVSLALLLQRRGLEIQYVAADLPADEWVRGAKAGDAYGVVISVPLPGDAEAASQALHALQVHGPRLKLYVGGGGRDDVEMSRVVVLDDDLTKAADLIAHDAFAREV